MKPPAFKHDLRQARRGDREALNRILSRNQRRLEGLARSRLGAALKARVRTSDVLQSTYLDVLKGLSHFQGEGEEAFIAWVARILENNIRDKGKYFAAKKRREPALGNHSPEEEQRILAHGPTPSAQMACSEDLILVGRALDRLPADYKQVIILRQVEGLCHRDAAALLGRSEAATRMLLSRARASLALEIERLRLTPPGGGGTVPESDRDS